LISGGEIDGKQKDNLNRMLWLYSVNKKIEHNRLFTGKGVISTALRYDKFIYS
jgi:hypothetical protein